MKTSTLLLLICLIGCDSSENPSDDFVPDTRIHALPISKADILCDGPLVEISGGDLMESADRIVVGKVTSVEAVQEFLPNSQNCASEHVNWSVRVRLEVEENLKGSGEIVEFTLGAEWQLGFWDSQPVYKRGSEWTPTWAGEPTFQVSSTFGWTKDEGLQPGQELLVFLWDKNGGLGPQSVPLAQRDANGAFQFQSNQIMCIDLPAELQGITLDGLRTALGSPAKSDGTGLGGAQYNELYSTCSVITTSEDVGNPDAG